MKLSTGVVCLAAFGAVAAIVPVANAADFKSKTVTMVIGNEPGGGTDGSGRLLLPFFEKLLPGQPQVVVRNMPGAQGVTALNYVYQQTKPDGLTLMVGSNSQVNPLTFKKAQGQYDPTKFQHIGGLGRGGSVLMISKAAEKRLLDKSAAPVTFGVIDPQRSASQMALWGIEFLGWNVKWVVGYRGSNETSLALERGEVDLTTTGNLFLIKRLVDSGNFRILAQTGDLDNGVYKPRAEFGDSPVFVNLVREKITAKIAKDAFGYYLSSEGIDKWIALSAGTPDDVVQAYRTAFQTMVKDPAFIETGKKISEDLQPQTHKDTESLISQMSLVTDETEAYIKSLLKKQGVDVK
jgi:tripartite-type tricarboxylate transporter receptor subunit TctC